MSSGVENLSCPTGRTEQFSPERYTTFRIHPPALEPAQGQVLLTYTLAGEDVPEITLREEIRLGLPEAPPAGDRLLALQRAAHLLALSAAPSFFKLSNPRTVEVPAPPRGGAEMIAACETYLQAVLRAGLGEYAYRNQIIVRPDISTHPAGGEDLVPVGPAFTGEDIRAPLVAVGGGKDSCVSIELVRDGGEEPTLIAIGEFPSIRQVAEMSGFPLLQVTRSRDPRLLELNAAGALNGHVPATAAVSAVALCAAVLHGYRGVVMSNERSAEEGNVFWDGVEVNHQWSKSLEFETLLRDTLRSVVALDVEYLSLLRPLSEYAITRIFSRLERYHDVFTSCNAAFRLDESRRVDRWCRQCPKCEFVFLMLAAWLGTAKASQILGGNLLDDPGRLAGMEELLGLRGHKPFECVGEVLECRAALVQLGARSDSEGVLIRTLLEAVERVGAPSAAQVRELLDIRPEHHLSAQQLEVLRAAL